MVKVDKKIILEALRKNPKFEKDVISKLKGSKNVLKKLKLNDYYDINQIVEFVKDDVRTKLLNMGEEVEDDLEKELHDKIDDLIEDDLIFFQKLDDPNRKKAVVTQLVEELT